MIKDYENAWCFTVAHAMRDKKLRYNDGVSIIEKQLEKALTDPIKGTEVFDDVCSLLLCRNKYFKKEDAFKFLGIMLSDKHKPISRDLYGALLNTVDANDYNELPKNPQVVNIFKAMIKAPTGGKWLESADKYFQQAGLSDDDLRKDFDVDSLKRDIEYLNMPIAGNEQKILSAINEGLSSHNGYQYPFEKAFAALNKILTKNSSPETSKQVFQLFEKISGTEGSEPYFCEICNILGKAVKQFPNLANPALKVLKQIKNQALSTPPEYYSPVVGKAHYFSNNFWNLQSVIKAGAMIVEVRPDLTKDLIDLTKESIKYEGALLSASFELLDQIDNPKYNKEMAEIYKIGLIGKGNHVRNLYDGYERLVRMGKSDHSIYLCFTPEIVNEGKELENLAERKPEIGDQILYASLGLFNTTGGNKHIYEICNVLRILHKKRPDMSDNIAKTAEYIQANCPKEKLRLIKKVIEEISNPQPTAPETAALLKRRGSENVGQ